MIKRLFYFILFSCVLISSDKILTKEVLMDKRIIEFYDKNKNYVCDFKIGNKLKKVKILYNKNIYEGYLDINNKPYGEWLINKNFMKECYLNNKKIFKSQNTLVYFEGENYFYEDKNDDESISLYAEIKIRNEKYNGYYKIDKKEIKLLDRNVDFYRKGRTTVESLLNLIFVKKMNIAIIIYE